MSLWGKIQGGYQAVLEGVMEPEVFYGAVGSLVTVVAGALGGVIARVTWVWHKANQEKRKTLHEQETLRKKTDFEQEIARGKAELEEETVREKTALDQWKELHGLQQDQLERLQKLVSRQEELIAELFEADTQCQVDMAHMYGWMERQNDFALRCVSGLRKHGEEVGPPPPLPPPPKRRDRRHEFIIRQTAQESVTLAAATDKIREISTPDALPNSPG